MAHDKKKQSTGSWKGKRDKHQMKKTKGPDPERGKNKIVGEKKKGKDKKRGS